MTERDEREDYLERRRLLDRVESMLLMRHTAGSARASNSRRWSGRDQFKIDLAELVEGYWPAFGPTEEELSAPGFRESSWRNG